MPMSDKSNRENRPTSLSLAPSEHLFNGYVQVLRRQFLKSQAHK
jgi:hypothetical protein